ncbi:MAG: hypothetical protein FWB73_00360 [Treponema sp.]|nr:hypothetical protein [Treponema sp.]
MMKFDVTVDSDILDRLATLGLGNSFPAANAAFGKSAKHIQGMWIGWGVGAGELDGIEKNKHPSTKYAQSIKIRKNAPFDVNIETDSPQMKRIQEGQPELDMKTTHPFGKKSRVSKDGVPYLIIPFRWGTPNDKGGKRANFQNVIPQNMHSAILAFDMEISQRLSTRPDGSQAVHIEKNYRGQPIQRDEYKWGGRLEAEGNVNGLVRFPDNPKTNTATYFTFRIISAHSRKGSWIRKEIAPIDVVSALERTTRPAVEKMINAGFMADLGL